MTDLNDDQRQFLETSSACEKQMSKIVKDASLQSIEDGSAFCLPLLLTHSLIFALNIYI
jgi:cellobiose-specific phosphotransferase system component IIC